MVISFFLFETSGNLRKKNFLGVLTVRIEDVNDNAPQFILDTLNTPRSVVEEATAGTLIGAIQFFFSLIIINSRSPIRIMFQVQSLLKTLTVLSSMSSNIP